MPDDSRTPRELSGDSKGPASPTRRKLLVTSAFAAASAVALRGLPNHARATHERRRPEGTEGPVVDGMSAPPALEEAEPQPAPDHTYDVAIRNGRLIDPDSGFDAKLTVGIDGGTITGFGADVQHARTTIDAGGRVVSPGFIDVLSYEPNTDGSWYKVADGVTTNLGMHGLQQGWWLPDFFDQYQGRTPVNFGGAFSDHWVRFHELGLDVGATATPSQIDQLAALFEEQLHQGWLGVALEPEYTPGVDFSEMIALAEVAERYDVPCFIHARYSSYDKEARSVPEAIELAKQSGAAVHIAHLPSTGGTWNMDQALEAIDAAVDGGHDVTFGLYPYDYWATYAGSTRFSDGWQDRFRIDYEDLQVAGTANRLTAATFATAQENNSLTVAYAIPESSVRKAIEHPRSLIGSDAIVDTGNNHPRASGTFCRVLGHWVRERKVLSLQAALEKMTILPAQRLDKRCPQLARKGRLQRGADADICIFDPDTVTDRATVEKPVAYSTGIDWVLIAGKVAKNPDGLARDELGGQPVKSVLD